MSKPQGPDPTPAIHRGPPARKEPHKWTVHEQPEQHGQLHVHTDVLRQVGAAMRGPDMYDLDDALQTLRHSEPALGSLSKWSTGSGFAGNVTAARAGFDAAAGQAGQVNGSAAKKLMDTADDYDGADATIRQKLKKHFPDHDGHHGG